MRPTLAPAGGASVDKPRQQHELADVGHRDMETALGGLGFEIRTVTERSFNGVYGGGIWLDLGPHMVGQVLLLFGLPLRVGGSITRQRDGAKPDV